MLTFTATSTHTQDTHSIRSLTRIRRLVRQATRLGRARCSCGVYLRNFVGRPGMCPLSLPWRRRIT